MNSWPDGFRHAISQPEHEEWNSRHYPGTRQLCVQCDQQTGRCEEDAIFVGESGPLCEECFYDLENK